MHANEISRKGAGSAIRHQLEVETDGPGDMGHFLNVMFRADYGPRLEGRRAILYPTFTDDNLEFFVVIDRTDLWVMHYFLQPSETAADFPSGRLQSIVVHVIADHVIHAGEISLCVGDRGLGWHW